MKKLSRAATPVFSFIGVLSLIFLPLAVFDYQVLFVGGKPLEMSLYKILTSDYNLNAVPQGINFDSVKTPLTFFSVFLMSAIFILALIFVLSLFLNKPGLFCVISSVGIISFIGAFISFMSARSALLSGKLFPVENMIQIRAFDLQAGFYLAFVFSFVIFILNVVYLKNADK